MNKKKSKKARKELEKIREEYLRCSQVKTDEEETGQEDKPWKELISILAGEAKLLTDIKRNLLIIINEMQLMKEEK